MNGQTSSSVLNNKAHRAGWSATREVSHWHLPAAKVGGVKKDSDKTDRENCRSRIRQGDTILYLPPRTIPSLDSCVQDPSRIQSGQFT